MIKQQNKITIDLTREQAEHENTLIVKYNDTLHKFNVCQSFMSNDPKLYNLQYINNRLE